MRLKLRIVLVAGCLLSGGQSLRAQQPPADASQPSGEVRRPTSDPVGENFIPPDMLIHNRDAVGLDDGQVEFLKAQLQTTQARVSDIRQRLDKEMEALAALVKSDHPDEARVLAQMDRVLDVERELTHVHLSLMVQTKDKLTPEQWAKATALKDKSVGLEARLTAKVRQVREGMERWQAEGRDPSPVGEIMQEFPPLMQDGKPAEAERVLDKALKALSKDQ